MTLMPSLPRRRLRLAAVVLAGLAAGCQFLEQSTRREGAAPPPAARASPEAPPQPGAPASPLQPAAPAPAATSAPVVPQPYEEAVLAAATTLFSKAQVPPEGRLRVVIDPLVDGSTGEQTASTRDMGRRIAELVRQRFPRFSVEPFNAVSLAASPLVMVGTFTPVNREGKTEGAREAYRICFALADLGARKIVSKGVARARMEKVDATPTTYFRDSPTWQKDDSVDAYIKTCQGTKPGDPVPGLYLDRINAAATLAQAMEAYDRGAFRDALALYGTAAGLPGGDQARLLNGLYLVRLKLGQREAATEAFAKVVDYGLGQGRISVKFLFRPGTAAFLSNPRVLPYDMWLEQIARQAQARQACLELSGHTSPTGPEPVNLRLSQLRAEFVRGQLLRYAPALEKRTLAVGKGSSEPLVGTGRDDLSDALDRRVVFQAINC